MVGGHPKGRLYQITLLLEGYNISEVQTGLEKPSLVTRERLDQSLLYRQPTVVATIL